MLLASVIVPAFNVRPWLSTCLDSLLRQAHRNLEIIVIDDGSTDGSGELADEYARRDQRVRVIHQENRGLSAVRNLGISLAGGELVFLVDSDDWVHPELVSLAIEAYRKFSSDIVMFKCAKVYEGTGRWSGGIDDFYWGLICPGDVPSDVGPAGPEMLALYPLAWLKAYSRRFLLKHGMKFIEGLKYEDNPYHVALIALSPRVAMVPRRLYAYRLGRPGQITGTAHREDGVRALSGMATVGFRLEPDYHAYLLIAMVRLLVTVARGIESRPDRVDFIRDATGTILRTAGEDVISRAIAAVMTLPCLVGDRIVVTSAFGSPAALAGSLGSGPRRYAGLIRCLLGQMASPGSTWDLAGGLGSLPRYASGTGDSGLGHISRADELLGVVR